MKGTDKNCVTKWGLLDPKLASRILLEERFEKQRDLRPWHVRAISKLLSNDKFDGRAVFIVHGQLPSGVRTLINGQHTCQAVKDTLIPLQCNFVTANCTDVEDMRKLYSVFDTQMKRTVLDAMRAAGMIEKITSREATNLGRAMRALRANFAGNDALGRHNDRPDLLETVDLVDGWMGEASEYFRTIRVAPDVMCRKWFRTGPICALGLLTYRFQPEKAAIFWSSMVSGDQLTGADPRKITRDYMMLETRFKITGKERVWIVLRAWNAFMGIGSFQEVRPRPQKKFFMVGIPDYEKDRDTYERVEKCQETAKKGRHKIPDE